MQKKREQEQRSKITTTKSQTATQKCFGCHSQRANQINMQQKYLWDGVRGANSVRNGAAAAKTP